MREGLRWGQQRTDLPGNVTRITGACRHSGKTIQITVPTDQLDRWLTADDNSPYRHIQTAMPEVPVGDREFLISGVSSESFDELSRAP